MLNKNRPIILVGGAPTAGKSTIAQSIADSLHLPWISTDQIRNIMRVGANQVDHPLLFETKNYTAQEFLTKFTAEQIVKMELREAEGVWPAIKMFIETDYTWENGFVIEGVNLLPHLIAKDFVQNKNIKSVFVVDEDVTRIRNIIFNRGLWDDASSYSDNLKEKEVEWVLLFSQKIRAEAEKYSFPWVKVQKSKEDSTTVLNMLGL